MDLLELRRFGQAQPIAATRYLGSESVLVGGASRVVDVFGCSVACILLPRGTDYGS